MFCVDTILNWKDSMKIVFATDGSNFSEAAAQMIAKQFRPQDCEIRVLNVVEPITTAAMPQMGSGYFPELEDQKRDAKTLVERTATSLSQAGFKTVSLVLAGDAKTVILDEAANWHADLIVLGSHGRKGLGRFLLGSVSEAVARHASCSVEIIRLPSKLMS
jgi:nucleotide-binding universal stress UspA family protein